MFETAGRWPDYQGSRGVAAEIGGITAERIEEAKGWNGGRESVIDSVRAGYSCSLDSLRRMRDRLVFQEKGLESASKVGEGKAHEVRHCLLRDAQQLGHLLVGKSSLSHESKNLLASWRELLDCRLRDFPKLPLLSSLKRSWIRSWDTKRVPYVEGSFPASLAERVDCGVPCQGEEKGLDRSVLPPVLSFLPEANERFLHNLFGIFGSGKEGSGIPAERAQIKCQESPEYFRFTGFHLIHQDPVGGMVLMYQRRISLVHGGSDPLSGGQWLGPGGGARPQSRSVSPTYEEGPLIISGV